VTPRGNEELPFFALKEVEDVVVLEAAEAAADGAPPLSPTPALFILLIMSRTELFLPAPVVVPLEVPVVSPDAAELELLLAPATEVTSPDFLSTPTMDQGLGLGSGLGLGAL